MKGSKAMNDYIRRGAGYGTAEDSDPNREILKVPDDGDECTREAAKTAASHKRINAAIRAASPGGND